LLPSLRWCFHQHCLDVVAVVALMSLFLVSSPTSHGCCLQYCMGAVTNSHGRHCQHCTGVNAADTLALLPLSYGCHCYGGILAVVAPASLHGCYQPCGGGVIANVAWCFCQHCLNAVAVAALTLLPLKSHGHHCIDARVSTPPWRWCPCQRCLGIVAVVALTLLLLVSLSTSHGHCLQHCMDAIASIAWVLSTLSRRHCPQLHLGVVTIVALASSPSLHWRLFQCCLDVDAIIALMPYSLLFWCCCQ
jgi:hypothetical protein